MLINLYYKLYRAMYYPITQLGKHAYGIIMCLVIAYVAWQFLSPDEQHSSAPVGAVVPENSTGQPTIFEDGNSAFSSDILVQMSAEERHYYSQIYYWVMNHQPADEPYSWQHPTMRGSLTPRDFFMNNYRQRCRRFSEVLQLQTTQQTFEGIACEKGGGAWCKLGPNYTPVCGMRPEGGFNRWLRNLF